MLEIDFFSGPFMFLSLAYQDPVFFRTTEFHSPLEALRSVISEGGITDESTLLKALRGLLLDKFVRNPASLSQLCGTVGRPLIWRLSEISDESEDIARLLPSQILQQLGVDDNLRRGNVLGQTLMEIRTACLDERLPEQVRGSLYGILAMWIRATFGDHLSCIVDITEVKDGKVIADHQFSKPYLLLGKAESVCDVEAAHPSVSRVHALILMNSSQQIVIVDLNSKSGTRVQQYGEQWTSLSPFVPFMCDLTSGSALNVALGHSSREYVIKRPDQRLLGEMERRLDKHEQELWVYVGNLPSNPIEEDVTEILDPAGMKYLDLVREKRCALVCAIDQKWLDKYLMLNGIDYHGNRIFIRRKN